MKVVYTLRHRLHHPEREIEASKFQPPFEHPGRAEAIQAALATDDMYEFVAPDEWGTAPIEAVHDPGMVRFLETAWQEYQERHGPTHDVVPDVFALPALRAGMGEGREPTDIGARFGWWCYETTTPLTETTYEAARASVDVALTAASIVLAGDPVAYALCRPPGHHAARSVYGGYCFFNNAAIVANHVAKDTGARVAVVDVDYHHGNGTQQIFYDRRDVIYCSLHADPTRAYPYHTGYADEIGVRGGTGANMNIPLPAGTDDHTYKDKLADVCEFLADEMIDFMVVSLGVDTYEGDPICDFALTTDGLRSCGGLLGTLGMPTVVVQEGGYADDALGANVHAWLWGIDDMRKERTRPERNPPLRLEDL